MAPATVDFPEPDKPVSQTVAPLTPLAAQRSFTGDSLSCQTTLELTASLTGQDEIKGVVETVLSRGKVVIENGEYNGKAGDGQFLKRGTYVAMLNSSNYVPDYVPGSYDMIV